MTPPKKPKPPATPRPRGSGVRTVYEQLKAEIIDLTLRPGSPIDEAQLSTRFAMSRTPIREALVRLAADGLVETLPNRSTIVSNIDFLNLSSFFDALTLMYRVTTRLAAQNRTEAELETIRARQTDYLEAVAQKNAPAMIAANSAFHAEIARAGKNKYYTELFSKVLDENRRILRLYYSSFNDEVPRQYVEEHEAIIAAIERRDVEAADKLATRHADQVVKQIQSYIAADRRGWVELG
ncbi:GntR family transcriptional regulator [Pelagibacterium halotolerans]|uniref:GntR family transcriptional regulator n=1 Tax=Pelagibacterium halotolerans TaxID=531813 RepID=UPI00384ADE42